MLLVALLLSLCLLAPLAANAALNSLSFKPPPPRPAGGAPGMVSVLVTARNEADRIGPLLESYAALTDSVAHELVVYDDDSEDGTGELVAAHAARDPRIRLMRGQGPPPGWNGKCHGLHRLYEQARGDYLLFLDADVALEDGALDRAVAAVEAEGYDVLSLYPKQIMRTPAERMFVPVMVYYFFLLGPQWMHRAGWRVPVCPLNGQFMLWRRASYEAIGGYAAIHDAWLDDMAMGRRVAERGLSACYRPGVGVARCRMYTGFPSAWNGFVKHTWDCLGLPVGPYMALHGVFALTMVGVWLAPLVALVRPLTSLEWAAFAGVAALTATTRV
ncbi:MAG: glycosyltransferase, partial [Candidatus Sericytochromatia bacterium]